MTVLTNNNEFMRNGAGGNRRNSKAHPQRSGWKPLNLELIEGPTKAPPAMPLNIFPPSVRDWITKSAASTGTPVDYIAMVFLAIFAIVLGSSRRAAPTPVWRLPVHLWILLVGPPASGKSPAIERALEPLRIVEQRLATAHLDVLADWRADEAWKQCQLKTRERSARRAEAAGVALDARDDALQPTPEPVARRFILSGATMAGLEAELQRGNSVLMIVDEIVSLFGSNAAQAVGLRQLLLTAYDGRAYRRARATGDIDIDRSDTALVGGIQPAVLARHIESLAADGFGARFFAIAGTPAPLETAANFPDDQVITEILETVLALPKNQTPTGPVPRDVTFSRGAVTFLSGLRQSARDTDGELAGVLGSFAGKAPGSIAKLAVILTYLDWSVSGGPEPRHVVMKDVKRAARFFDEYLLPQAQCVYASADLPPLHRCAAEVLKMIRAKGWHQLPPRDLLRCGMPGLTAVADLDPVLALLEEAGVLRWVPDTEHRPRGGRPRVLYQVHPDIAGSGAA